MPRRHRSDQQHQAALAHENHRADPNYPREHAGSCAHCAALSLELLPPAGKEALGLPDQSCATPAESPVPDDVLRLVALTADGSLVVPADAGSQGYRFWVGAVADVQDHIAEHGTEHLLMNARWQIPELGEGRLLDRCSSQQLAEMAAETHVAEVDLGIDAEPVSSLEQALLITMTALYEAVWEAVARLLGAGELRVQYHEGRLRVGGGSAPILTVAH